MPFYQIFHSYPLTDGQRQRLATSITNLHCSTFTTPSFFVHVQFISQDASDRTYYMAGKPRTTNTNRITGIVRTAPGRSKSDFDALAARIEEAWYDSVAGGDNAIPQEEEAKRLLMVMFTPMTCIREGGMVIPEAGQEGSWIREQLPYMREMSDVKGVDDFTEMLKEIEEREDLRALLATE